MKSIEEREAIKQRLKSAKKYFRCDGCGCEMTVFISYSCNCGGNIKPITEGGGNDA